MSVTETGYERGSSYYTGGGQREALERRGPESRYLAEERGYGRGLSGWKIAGLAVVALGLVGFYYFEGDLRRYLKIRNM
jgi:hypothetical protein